MNIGFVGLGKLGLPVALAIESKGHSVVGYDINPDVKEYVKQRQIPYREEGLQPLLDETRLNVLDSIEDVVAQSEVVFLPVQTPHGPEYEGTTRIPDTRADFDYSYLISAISQIKIATEQLNKPIILDVISTCLPGTFTTKIQHLLNDKIRYVYCPQFIAMGTVLNDYLNPEFNLIGVQDQSAADELEQFYTTINEAPCVKTDVTTAEGIKVFYNTLITAKTVLGNSMGEMSERLGMNVDDIYHALSLSTKRIISMKYLKAGMSDGGGCHPRDNIALSHIANKIGMSHNIWEDLMEAREKYEEWHAELIADLAEMHRLPIVLLGRAFKPETDIETGSPAILISNLLTEYGYEHEHVNDTKADKKAIYFIATENLRYKRIKFVPGSIVLDPFGIIPMQGHVMVQHLGRKRV